MLDIFTEGICYGIVKNRYSSKHLKLLLNYPDFYEKSFDSLIILWYSLPVYKNNVGNITICKYPKDGREEIELSEQEKNELLKNGNYDSRPYVKEIAELIKKLSDKVNLLL